MVAWTSALPSQHLGVICSGDDEKRRLKRCWGRGGAKNSPPPPSLHKFQAEDVDLGARTAMETG